MDLGLRSRACILTGATGGIGRATALTLAAEGAALALVGRRQAVLDRLKDECVANGATGATTIHIDITDPTAADTIVAHTKDEFRRVDVLINNAGAMEARAPDDITDEEWQLQWDLHVMAPMRLTRAAGREMAERGWGRIVNVTSSSGKRPSGSNMAYSVTKSAQLALSRSFAEIYAADNVLVNAIAPGPLAGDMWLSEGGLADQLAKLRGQTREEVLAATAAKVPLGRLGTEQEIADVIVFLCSQQVSNVTGSAWNADGGSVPVII